MSFFDRTNKRSLLKILPAPLVALAFLGCSMEIDSADSEILQKVQQAVVLRSFDFESGTTVNTDGGHRVCHVDQEDEHCQGLNPFPDGLLTIPNGDTFLMQVKGDPLAKRVWLSGLEHEGKKSIAYEIGPTAYGVGDRRSHAINNDKVFHRGTNSADHLTFNAKRYMRFFFYVPGGESFQNPTDELLIMQAFQSDGGSPPFALHFVKNTDTTIEFRYRSGTSGSSGSYDSFGRTKLLRDKWYQMVIRLEPKKAGEEVVTGEMRFWLYEDGARCESDTIAAQRRKDKFGYAGAHLGGLLSLHWGLYRKRQPRFHKIHFDDIKIGGTFAAVTDFDETCP